jgi:hypothetical protein
MRQKQRPRRYVNSTLLSILFPLFRYSLTRDAYVLRIVGQRLGPVLRVNRRRRATRGYSGPERRRGARSGAAAQLAGHRG